MIEYIDKDGDYRTLGSIENEWLSYCEQNPSSKYVGNFGLYLYDFITIKQI